MKLFLLSLPPSLVSASLFSRHLFDKGTHPSDVAACRDALNQCPCVLPDPNLIYWNGMCDTDFGPSQKFEGCVYHLPGSNCDEIYGETCSPGCKGATICVDTGDDFCSRRCMRTVCPSKDLIDDILN